MTAKVEIVKRLGEQAVLLPSLIAEALNANDRIKLRLTMLQEAAAHASSTGSAAPSFQAERQAAGLSDPQFDRVITGARPLDGDRIAIPGVAGLLAGIPVDLATMLAPVEAVDPESGKSLRARLDDLRKRMPSVPDGVIGRDEIRRMTSARRGREDSLHLLVMDAHKALKSTSRCGPPSRSSTARMFIISIPRIAAGSRPLCAGSTEPLHWLSAILASPRRRRASALA